MRHACARFGRYRYAEVSARGRSPGGALRRRVIGLHSRSMRWAGVLLVHGLVVGCGFSSPSPSPSPDSKGSEDCAWETLARHVVPCDLPAGPAGTIATPGGTFDTTDGTYTAGAAPK